MDKVDFFNLILPASGLRCLAVPEGKVKGQMAHFWGASNEWLVKSACHIDSERHLNTYFACASYKTRGSRSQDNVAYVRSFWVDLDVGETKPGKPPKYATAKDAAAAVLRFAHHVGLPRPFLVASGYGVHAYWPMDADIVPDVWTVTANMLKAALKVEGVLADPTRTADRASILRPPGTHNWKNQPRPVRVVVEGDVGRLTDFQTALLPYAKHVSLPPGEDDFLPEGGPVAGLTGSNSDLTSGVEYQKASARQIADECGVMALVRDTQGQVDQPTWYRAIGIIGYCEEGEPLAHEWSKGDPRYTPEETSRELARYMKASKPATCERFGENHSTICAACPHAGKINSPVALGYQTQATTTVTIETTTRTQKGFSLAKAEMEFPYGFRAAARANGKMVLQHRTMVEDKDGNEVEEWEVFCETRVVPVTRLWIEGVAHVEFEMDLQGGAKRRFLLEGGLIGKGKDTLAAELARNEVVVPTGLNGVMDSYMRAWMQRLKEEADQVVAYRHFGWSDRSFVLGDSIIHPGGNEHRAVLVGMAKSKREALVSKGNLTDWVEIVDRAYNRPGQEAFQFLVVAGFAAPLLSMMQQVSGVTIYAHSEGSGVGKTTAQRVALSAWGDWEALMLADQKITQNALWGLMGAYHSLPIVYDELTNMPNNLASELVFSASSGRSKERMNAAGELRENNANWSTILMASGNNLLSEKLSLHRGNAEAEISRLFEFTLTATPHLTPNEANALFPKLKDHYGHAGRVFIEYVVNHYDEVTEALRHCQGVLNERMGITQVERYWSALLAACTVAASLCRKLDILRFPAAPLNKWMAARVGENRIQRDASVSQPLELLGSMLSDLWSGVLVTNGEGDIRQSRIATVVQAPRGPMVGRAIIPTMKNEAPVLMLNAQAMKDWANRKGVSAREIFTAAVQAGWADAQLVRYSLGKGTIEYSQTSSYLQCWKLNPERIGSAAGQQVAQKLGVVDGGSGHAASGQRP